jgi:NAD(P)-dependent dehydrogenase (short-subunit alcohol dehydrogenase family)
MTDRGLAGQVAIVTGAGSRGPGIGNGRAAAVLLADAGANVVVVDSLLENLAVTCQLIEERGGSFMPVIADVSTLDGCAAVVHQAVSAYGRLDVLVNNVGVGGPPGSVVDVDLNAWDSCLRVNVTSMLLMARCAIPEMRAAGSGTIINLSSVAGLLGGHPHVAYSTTKAAIVGLTRTMAATHALEGIRVNAIAPGMVYTPMIQGPGFSDSERELRRMAAPLETEGTGWDVGAAVVFLASPAARWITGVILPVDAGLTATMGQARAIYSRIANPIDSTAPGSAS